MISGLTIGILIKVKGEIFEIYDITNTNADVISWKKVKGITKINIFWVKPILNKKVIPKKVMRIVAIGSTTIGKTKIVKASNKKQKVKNKIDFIFEKCKLKIWTKNIL